MKKKVLVLLPLIITAICIVLLLPKSVKAAGDVAINSTNFPDDNFREYVKNTYDLNHDGYLSTEEAGEEDRMYLRDINYDGTIYQDLKGIEYFIGLEELVCRDNNITSLELSALKKLEKLDCSGNVLKTLDLSANKNLVEINCSNNKLKTLKLGTLSNLENLDCSDNQLTGLNVTGCSELRILELSRNKLTGIDLSKNTDLMYLNCYFNQLTELDISKLESLKRLGCGYNKLTELDANQNEYLEELYCNNNQLTVVHVGKAFSLIALNCANNQLLGLDTVNHTNLSVLNAEGNPGIKYNIYKTSLAYRIREDLATDIIVGGPEEISVPVEGQVGYYSDVNPFYSFDDEPTGMNNIASFDTDDIVIALSTPAISAANTASGIKVSWKKVKSAAEYEVWRAPKGSTNYKLLKTVTGTSYTDKTAAPGNAYAYRICAKNGVFYSKNAAKPIVRNPFTDVSESASYFSAVMWAVQNGITSGTSATTFSPNQDCARYQFAVMLYKLAGKPAVSGTLPFKDVKKTDSYYNAVLWAYTNGIISGTSATTFSPKAGITRYQVVAMLYKFAGKPLVSGSLSFVDVSTKASYYKAVIWAVQNGITKGTDATHFSPNAVCKRYQLVVFLYKYNNIYHVK